MQPQQQQIQSTKVALPAPSWHDAVSQTAPYDVQRCAPQPGREFGRYLLTGSIAFGIDMAVLVLLTEALQISYLIANIFGFCIAVTVSYMLCINWVFKTRRMQCAVSEFSVFVLVALLGLLVNESCMWMLVDGTGVHYTLAKVLATGLVFMLNFVLRKVFLFR